MDSDFCVVVNDGASGVVIDGELGHTNMLQCLNHSCDPNAELRFAWADGCWHAVFYTICDIEPVCARTLIVYLNMNHICRPCTIGASLSHTLLLLLLLLRW